MSRCVIIVVTAILLIGCADGTTGSVATGDIGVTSQSDATAAPSSLVPTTAPSPTTVPPSDLPSTPPSIDSTTVTTSPPWPGPCGRRVAGPSSYDHVIWIWMENKSTHAVLDSTAAPFIRSLAESCGAASHYVDHGIHPSLPNYLAATSGDTYGLSDDAAPQAHPLEVDNIFRQVRRIGKVSRSYQENMPSNCALRSTSHYAVKHNPAAYFIGEDDRDACQRDNVAFDQFLPDLDNDPPAFSFITPDICNDMHDCAVSTGDTWLKGVVTAITSSATYRDGRTAVFIVFDESQGGGTMPFIAIAPSIAPGTRVETELDHYSLLAFTEDALGTGTRLGQAVDAPSLADAFGI